MITLNHPVDMDQTLQPLPAQFIIEVDGVPKTPDSVLWIAATQVTLLYAEVALGPTLIQTQYPVMFGNYISLVNQPVFPFDLTTTPI